MSVKRVCIIFLALLSLSLASGCEEPSNNPVKEYGVGLVNSYSRSKGAARAANLDAIKRTIAAFRAANGRYPESLDETAAFMGAEIDPDAYDYDPETGQIILKGQ
jgi:hypothetical protein